MAALRAWPSSVDDRARHSSPLTAQRFHPVGELNQGLASVHRDLALITLTFRPVHGESPMLVRGMHFRICADATLRGSDNEIAAVYTKRLWQLGSRQYRTFECGGPIYLRVTHRAGSREHLGPYAFLKATEGAIFTHDNCLGVHAPLPDAGASADVWQEIAFLSAL